MKILYAITVLIGSWTLWLTYETVLLYGSRALYGPMSPGFVPEADLSTSFELVWEMKTLDDIIPKIDKSTASINISLQLRWSAGLAIYFALSSLVLIVQSTEEQRKRYPFNRKGIKFAMMIGGTSAVCSFFHAKIGEFVVETFSRGEQANKVRDKLFALVIARGAFARLKWAGLFCIAGHLAIAYQRILAPMPKTWREFPRWVGSGGAALPTAHALAGMLGGPALLQASAGPGDGPGLQYFLGIGADLLRVALLGSLGYHAYMFWNLYILGVPKKKYHKTGQNKSILPGQKGKPSTTKRSNYDAPDRDSTESIENRNKKAQ